MLRSAESEDPKLISREIIFEDFRSMCSGCINATDGQTDGQTDDLP